MPNLDSPLSSHRHLLCVSPAGLSGADEHCRAHGSFHGELRNEDSLNSVHSRWNMICVQRGCRDARFPIFSRARRLSNSIRAQGKVPVSLIFRNRRLAIVLLALIPASRSCSFIAGAQQVTPPLPGSLLAGRDISFDSTFPFPIARADKMPARSEATPPSAPPPHPATRQPYR